MGDAGANLLPPGAVIAGETLHIVWDTRGQSVDYARAIAAEARRRGGIVRSCSLDAEVKRDHECPVCGAKGLV